MGDTKVTLHPCQGWGCHEHCTVEVHSKGDRITRVQKHRMPGEESCNEICMKGVLSAQIPYAEDRILYPMKRVGERGSGEFERISWDEALDTIAEAIKKSTAEHGPRSIVLNQFWCGYPGDYRSTGNDLIYRFAFAWDASILEYQSVDYGLVFGHFVDSGLPCNNSHKVLREQNKLIIIWGGNPLGYTRPAATTRLLLDAQERGAKIVHISNLFDVTSAKADEWVPVKSGTDAALALAMSHVLIRDGLVNEQFLLARTASAYLVRTDTGAYLRQSDVQEGGSDDVFVVANAAGEIGFVAKPTMTQPFMMTGYGDFHPVVDTTLEVAGIPCKSSYRMVADHVAGWTPERQEQFTGVSAAVCERLAHEYAENPTTMYQYYGFRYQNGVQSVRALNMLCFLAGHYGGENGATLCIGGDSEPTCRHGLSQAPIQFPQGYDGTTGIRESMFNIVDGFADPSLQQHKVWLNCMGNPLLNWPNKSMWKERILPNLDLFVAWEIRMTDTARMADIILPEACAYERWELICETDSCVVLSQPAIPAQGEAKDPAWIWQQLAIRLGIPEHFPFDMEGWEKLKADYGLAGKEARVYDEDNLQTGTAPITFDLLKEQGAVRVDLPYWLPTDILAMDLQTTTTGRLEFYNEGLVSVGPMADDQPADINLPGKRDEYPLQFYVGRHKYFMQGQFTNIAESRMLAASQFGVALNPKEAARRNMVDGEIVEVFNDKGVMRVPLQLRDDIPEGMAHTWYSFDETWYPDTNPPQGIMNAENMHDRETEFQKVLGPMFEGIWGREFQMPQPLVHKCGDTTPEGLWDNVCEVRKVSDPRKEA